MKVALLHNFHGASAPSGENEAVESDTALLRSYGHEVCLIRWDMDRLAESRVEQLRTALLCAWNPAAYRRVRRALSDFDPDIVHIHNTFPQTSPAVFYAARGSRAAIVFSTHNYRAVCASGLLLRDAKPCRDCMDAGSSFPAIRHKCYRGSRLATIAAGISVDLHRRAGTFREIPHAIIAFTDFQRELLAEAGFERSRIHVRPHHYANPAEPIAWAARSMTMLYVGRLSAEKGVDVLLQALAMVPDAPSCEIIGDGRDRGALEETATQSGLKSRVRFLGLKNHEETQQAIRSSRLVIIPSICNEGFPMVFREAMAAGTPVLASRIGALAEIVQHRSNGYSFDAGSPEALARALRDLMRSPWLLEEMSATASRYYLENLSGAAGHERLMSIYKAAQRRRALQVGGQAPQDMQPVLTPEF
jgi:glycosyltransferase involved in cell wall biosynthesis